VTGFWYLDQPEGYAPPVELARFLAAGEPPVYIGFGSMSTRDPRRTGELALRALELSGRRGVLMRGWGGLDADDLSPGVTLIDETPHAWLFPQLAAVVHHGGAGTTGAGLRAGVPAVVVPFFADQPFWVERVAGLGAGPAPIPRRRLSAEALARAIEQATTAEMRARAAELGRHIAGEDGVGAAVKQIERIVAGFTPAQTGEPVGARAINR
jgi:UDP:flavonoid glycosyltransferase YjiC (YdhE family)